MSPHRRSALRSLVAMASLAALVVLAVPSLAAQTYRVRGQGHPIVPPSHRSQVLTSLAVDGSGTVTALWEEWFASPAGSLVWTRRFNGFDRPLGPAVLLAGANKAAAAGRAATNLRGDWLVSWGQHQTSGENWVVQYTSSGGRVFRVRRPGRRPLVAVDDRGRFVVVWHVGEAAETRVRAQRFDAAGNPLGAEIPINGDVTGEEPGWASVAMNPRSGDFVAVWESVDRAQERVRLLSRRFQLGLPGGGAVRELDAANLADLNFFSPYFAPGTAWTDGDRFSIVWQRQPADSSEVALWLQRFNGDHVSPQGKVQVTANASIPDGTPRIAGSPSGETLLTWDDNGTSPIYYRLYRGSSLPAGRERSDLVRFFSSYVGTGQIAFGPGDELVTGWTNFVDSGNGGYNIAYKRFPLSLLREP